MKNKMLILLGAALIVGLTMTAFYKKVTIKKAEAPVTETPAAQ